MDYLDFFNLSDEPFGHAPLPRFYYGSEQHTNALSRLMYSAKRAKGLALLIGDIGRGKTTLARRMLDSLPEHEFEAAMLVMVHTGITPSWLLKRIAIQLGVPDPADDKLTILSQLYQRLVQIHQSGRKALVLVDEAQMLQSREIMEEFRGLLNLELPGHKLISFVFFGLPPVEHYLALDPPLAQRVALRYRLGPLSAEDTTSYIHHRLTLVGGDPAIFDAETVAEVHRYSEGVPRVINTICDNVLLELYFAQRRTADADLVCRVADNLNLGADSAGVGRAAGPSIEPVAIDERPAIDGGPGADAIVAVNKAEPGLSADAIAARVAGEAIDEDVTGGAEVVELDETEDVDDLEGLTVDVEVTETDAEDEPEVAASAFEEALDEPEIEIHVSAEGEWDEAAHTEEAASTGESIFTAAAEPLQTEHVEITIEGESVEDAAEDGEGQYDGSDEADEAAPEVEIADPLAFLGGAGGGDADEPTPIEAAFAVEDAEEVAASASSSDDEAAEDGLGDNDADPVELVEEVTEPDSAATRTPEDTDAIPEAFPAQEHAATEPAEAPRAPTPPQPGKVQPKRFTTKTGKVIDLAEIDDLLADLD